MKPDLDRDRRWDWIEGAQSMWPRWLLRKTVTFCMVTVHGLVENERLYSWIFFLSCRRSYEGTSLTEHNTSFVCFKLLQHILQSMYRDLHFVMWYTFTHTLSFVLRQVLHQSLCLLLSLQLSQVNPQARETFGISSEVKVKTPNGFSDFRGFQPTLGRRSPLSPL